MQPSVRRNALPRAKIKSDRAPGSRQPSKAAKGSLPLTISRPELLPDGTDRDFRRLVHNIFAFMARHDAVRDGHARHIGLAGVEYTVLISIGHLGLDGDVNVKTVADHLHMSGAFITTVTSKLQSLGLVEKTQDHIDRRRITLAITDKGKALLRRLAPYQREVNDVEFGSLTREQFQLLSTILENLIDCGDKAVALQRYKSTIKDGKVA
jgi:MarR family transcriptional regulator, organic hydroperoxide resistance regulator